MGWQQDQHAANVALHGAMREVVHEVAGLRDAVTPEPEVRGYVSDLRNTWRGIPGLGLAMTMCRDTRDGVVGLAQLTRRVPNEYISRACIVGDRLSEVFVVKCTCGAWMVVPQRLSECAGGCHRWFFADEYAVFAMRLPEQEAE